MARKKKINVKEKLLNLELYIKTLEERIDVLEKATERHSSYISHNVTDIRELEVKVDRLELESGEKGGMLAELREDVKVHDIHFGTLDEAVNGILKNAKDTETKNSIINYLISTDFKGTVRHKRLIFKMKKDLKDALKYNSFEELKKEILNGDRSLDDLLDYKRILLQHEKEQTIIDYCNKEE